MEVPEIVLVAVLEPIQEERMLTPGAKISRAEPKFEKDGLASLESMAPTVMAEGAEAGETLAAFWFSLPAATTTVIPALKAAVTALLTAVEKEPPRDMERTDPGGALLVTH